MSERDLPPHQLTRRRFMALGGYNLPDDHALIKASHLAQQELRGAGGALLTAAPMFRSIKMDTATKRTTLGAAMEYQPHVIETALRSPKVPRTVKQRYRDAKEALQKLSDLVDEACDHKTLVVNALAAVETISPEVLADYPELVV